MADVAYDPKKGGTFEEYMAYQAAREAAEEAPPTAKEAPIPEVEDLGRAAAKAERPDFDTWYADIAGRTGLDPNPDDPEHFYDYRKAYEEGVRGPSEAGKWPSKYKREGHREMVVDGRNTKTGEVVPEKDYGAKYDELMKGTPEDWAAREKARTAKLSFMEALPYILTGGGDAPPAITMMQKALEAKRTGGVKALDDERKRKIADYIARKKFGMAEQEADPTSELSRIAQAYMKKLDPKQDWSGQSAEELKQYMGPYLKIYESDAKHALAEARMEQTREHRATRGQERKDKAFDAQRRRDFNEVSDVLKTMAGAKRTGARGQFIQANTRANLTEDGLRVIDQVLMSPLMADKTIEAELAAQIAAAMMGGNQPAQETIEHFMSNTRQSNLAGVFKWVTGKPQDAMTPAILRHYRHQLEQQNKFWKGKRANSVGLFGISLERVFENPVYGRGESDRFARGVAELEREYPYEPEDEYLTRRKTKDGRIGLFNPTTKEFVKYEGEKGAQE